MAWDRADIVVAAFAAGGPGAEFDPVRVQNLLFLVDRQVSERIGGPFFDFQPCRYGPLDRAIYDVIDRLASAKLAQTDAIGSYRRYLLTDTGLEKGQALLTSLPGPVADYFGRAARWARLMPFQRMLAAICREYPEMAVNGAVRQTSPERSAWRPSPFALGILRVFGYSDPAFRLHRSKSDAEAIAEVWRTVGRDIEDAMVRFGEQELW